MGALAATGTRDHLRGLVAPAMHLHLRPQPARRVAQRAARKLFVQPRHRVAHRPVQAPGIDIAEAVGREIAEQPHRPVHILQHAIRRAIHRIAEIRREAVVPRGLEIVRRQIARNERLFQIEAQHDMQVVLHLVRLGADEPAMHPVDRAVEGLDILHPEIAERLAHPGVEPPGERPAAPQLVLVDAALAFVHAHRHALPQGRQAIAGVDPLLVAGVAHLVDRGIEAVERVMFGHPRGDAHIVARAGRERMHRHVKPPAREIIAKATRQFARQAQLRLLVEMRVQRGPVAAQRAGAQIDQPGPHLGKYRVEPSRRHLGLEIVDEGIIEVAPPRHRRRLLAFQSDHLGQNRGEGGVIIRRPRLGPLALRPAGQPRQRHRQIAGHPRRAVVIAADVMQLRARHLVRHLRLGLGQQIAAPRIGAPGVQHRLHRARFLGPLFGGTSRHHGFLIPTEPAGHLRERLRVALLRHQIVIGRHARAPLSDVARGYWLRNRARRISTQSTTATN